MATEDEQLAWAMSESVKSVGHMAPHQMAPQLPPGSPPGYNAYHQFTGPPVQSVAPVTAPTPAFTQPPVPHYEASGRVGLSLGRIQHAPPRGPPSGPPPGPSLLCMPLLVLCKPLLVLRCGWQFRPATTCNLPPWCQRRETMTSCRLLSRRPSPWRTQRLQLPPGELSPRP